MPSLSALIGGTSAVTVLTVAAVTLTVTLHFSLGALRDVAVLYTDELAAHAASQVQDYLEATVRTTGALQKFYMALPGNYTSPADRPGTTLLEEFARIHYALYLTAPQSEEVSMYYRDGSSVFAYSDGAGGGVALGNVVRGGNVTPIATVYYANGTEAPEEESAEWLDGSDYGHYFAPDSYMWPLLARLTGANADKAIREAPLYWVSDPADPASSEVWYLGWTRALRTPNGTVYATPYSAVTMSALGQFLRRARATAGSQIFLVEPNGALMGTSATEPFATRRVVEPGTAVPDNCYSTEHDSTLVFGGPIYLGCRYTATSYPFAPLNELATERGLAATDGTQRVRLAGRHWFVAVTWFAPAETVESGVGAVVLMPEDDVAGAIAEGRDLAIGISAAVFVVAVAASFAAVHLLLRPLRGVSARVRAAADLEKDDTPREESGISEVRELQRSYYALSDELERLAAFVPQSVLAARKRLSDDDADNEEPDEEEEACAHSGNERRRSTATSHRRGMETDTDDTTTVRSRRARSSAGSRIGGPTGGHAPALNLAASLSRRRIAVVALNCRGFHLFAAGQPQEKLKARYGEFVAALMRAVDEARGVVDVWHGDRVLVSFNAAREVSGAARRAVGLGLQLATAVVPQTLGLAANVGVAAGRAEVGNVGCATAMRFSAFGPVVSAAAWLANEGGREYAGDEAPEGVRSVVPTGSVVLATGAVQADAETAFVMRSVDYRPLAGKLASVVAQVLAPLGTGSGADMEWLYVVGGESKLPENAVFNAIAADDIESARALCTAALDSAKGGAGSGVLERAMKRIDAAAAVPDTQRNNVAK